MVILRLHLVCGGELGGEGGAAPVLHAVGVQQVQQQLRIAAVRTTAFHPTTSCLMLLACSAKKMSGLLEAFMRRKISLPKIDLYRDFAAGVLSV